MFNKLHIFETRRIFLHNTTKTMRNFLFIAISFFFSTTLLAQSTDCYKQLEDAFLKRGSYTVADEMHKNVIICFFRADGTECLSGKCRVENGTIVDIFLMYEDGVYELMEKKFTNAKKTAPTITNGISELIVTVDGEKMKIVFIDKLKPKQKAYKQANLPTDL